MNLKKYDTDLLAAVESTNKKLLPLFRRAVERAESELEILLAENAISRAGDGPAVYHCMARDKYVHGHNHHGAQRVAKGKARPSDFQYFGNPLIVDEDGAGPTWTKPSARATLGEHLTYTFEFDCLEAGFLAEQCSWVLPTKEWRRSPVGKVFEELHEFADFRLLNVTYSGNKSLHINVVMDTVLLLDRAGQSMSPDAIRVGFRAHWWGLREVVLRHLRPSGGLEPDAALATSTALRRMPNGLRKVGHDHPLGLSKGSKVRQVVLWERSVQRNAATGVFHSPSLFTSKVPTSRARKPSGHAASRAVLTPSQLTYCEDWLRKHYEDSGLIFEGLDLTGDGYVARFRNSVADSNAGSFMTEDFVLPSLQGRDKDTVGHIEPLSLPLGMLLGHLAAEADTAKRFDPADLEITRARLDNFMPYWLVGNEMMMIHAAEGVGKTTSIMRHIGLSKMTGHSGQYSMFAFSTYEDAARKADEFNFPGGADQRRTDGFVGVVWRSFTRRYQDAASAVTGPILLLTIDDADEAGMSLWEMVQQMQPAVAQVMREELEEDWAEMEGRNVVLFTVHDVAHQWADNTFTRQMVSPTFFDADFEPFAAPLTASELNWLVHDEVSVKTFIDTLSSREMGWLRALKGKSNALWSSGSGKAQRAAYSNFRERVGHENGVQRAEAQRALRSGLDRFETITISDAREYGFETHDQTFFSCDGEEHYVRPRNWWADGDKQIANRVVFLTTECVPALVAQKAIEGLTYIRPRSTLGCDAVDVRVSRTVNAKTIPHIARLHAGTGTWVIANKLLGAPETVSPYAVRGRNDLAEADVVQLVTMFHPSQYRELQALGTWLGRNDLALLTHVDQINQSCGRNRGPRNKGANHTVVMNLTLFRAIVGNPSVGEELRYTLRLQMDELQRKNARQRSRNGLWDDHKAA